MYVENEILFYDSHYFKLYNIIQLLFMAKFPTNSIYKFLHFCSYQVRFVEAIQS